MIDDDDALEGINDDTNIIEDGASDDVDVVDGNVMNDDGDDLEEIKDYNNVVKSSDEDVGYSGGVADLINGSDNANGDSDNGGSHEVATVIRWRAP